MELTMERTPRLVNGFFGVLMMKVKHSSNKFQQAPKARCTGTRSFWRLRFLKLSARSSGDILLIRAKEFDAILCTRKLAVLNMLEYLG